MLNQSGYYETMTLHMFEKKTLFLGKKIWVLKMKRHIVNKSYYMLTPSQMHRVLQDKNLLHTCCKSDA